MIYYRLSDSLLQKCWYACFSVEYEATKLPHNSNNIGVDVGLEAFATLSNGTRIENHRYYQAAQAKLRRAQRKVARRVNKKSKRTNTLPISAKTFSTS
jgi:putative transposase